MIIRYAVAIVTTFTALASAAQTGSRECAPLMAYNTTVLTNNVAAQYSILQFVNQQNYEEMKRNAGAVIPGYFSGKYSEFQAKRSHLQSMLSATGAFREERGFYQHALSADGAAAFGKCVAERGNLPLSAWIENKEPTPIVVMVRNGLAGASSIVYTVTGASPTNRYGPLTANSTHSLLFDRDVRKPFVAVINGTDQATGATYSRAVELPVLREFRRMTVHEDQVVAVRCAAGCGGSTTGCLLRTNGTMTASPGFSFERDTLQRISDKTLSEPGAFNVKVDCVDKVRSDGSIGALECQVESCEGHSGHTQGTQEVRFRARTVREYIREVTAN